MAEKILDIEERINRSLQDSLNELYLLKQEEAGHLEEVKERARSLVLELRELAVTIDKTAKDYDASREMLVESAWHGEKADEKVSYQRASEYMKIRGSLEERYRLLSAQKDELMREERRLERLMTKCENMGNRLRMVLTLIASPEEFTVSDNAEHNTETMLAAFILAEREAITFARELHDGPTQTFSAVGLMLEMVKEFLNRAEYERAKEENSHAIEQTHNGLNEIRAFLFNLNPTGIEGGFEMPLKRLAMHLHQTWKCKMTFTLSGDFDDVSAHVKVGAFKTLHQAVLNAASHGATEIKVNVNYSQSHRALRVRITDNGNGFDVEQEKIAAKERGSYGLANMEDRVKMLGGRLSISSAFKKGSSVSFFIPILLS